MIDFIEPEIRTCILEIKTYVAPCNFQILFTVTLGWICQKM